MSGFLDWMKRELMEGSPQERRSGPVEALLAQERRLRSQLEEEVARLRSVLRITASMTSMLHYDRVLDLTLDLGAAALSDNGSDVGKVVGALLMFEGDRLHIASGRGLSQADLRVVLPAQRGILEESLSSTEMSIIDEPSRDPELQRLAALHPCRQAVCIPLGVGLELYGLLLFAHAEDGFFDDRDRLELLGVAAQQATIALQNARLYRELEQEKERMSDIQDDARKKLARDLHDGPTQSIGAIAMRVNFARRLMERDPRQAADELYKIEDLARRTTKEIRQMLFTLRPLVLESQGLVEALHHLAAKTQETHGQKVRIDAEEGVADALELGKQGVVFFIVEEAVNNARKHAQADSVWVRLSRHDDLMQVEVVDDGKGFDVAAVREEYSRRGSLGMVNLHERTELVNGVLKIESEPGGGTTIRVIVPLTVEAAERLHRAGFAA